VTGGKEQGTGGWSWVQWKPWLLLGCIGFVVALVNATSGLMEAARDGRVIEPSWAPFLWEYSSWVMLLALAPFVGEAIRRFPPRRETAARFALIHLGALLAFSIIHVAGMVALRKIGYWAVGRFYDFSHGNLALTFIYEARKDAISYALFAVIFYLFQRREERASATSDGRIELRDGATAAYVTPSDILYVEAAGNYVEFHTAAKTHLVRATLASWEARLTARGFVRVHRSRLVNRAHIAAIKPTPAGDVEITLDTGAVLLGSRRYRAALDAAPAA
jgi:hypothetical protein